MEKQNIMLVNGQEIEIIQLIRLIWHNRKVIIKWSLIGACIGLIIGFSIPKEYTTTVKLSPETQGAKSSLGSFSSLASMAGINLNSMNTMDAVYPELYPDVVSSIPFLTNLFSVPVSDQEGELQTVLYDYIFDYTRTSWWNEVLSWPSKVVGGFVSLFQQKTERESDTLSTFYLTRNEMKVLENLKERINCIVDKKTNVITLEVTMQDPWISATLTDTIMSNLQQYITNYRTNKARLDLQYTQKLFEDARRSYYAAQQIYANYVDKNQNIVLQSVRAEQERLRNEMDLAYNLYNQMAQQLQVAKAKVQEQVPVYTIIQPATVPLKPSKPSKLMILIGLVCLSGIAAIGWTLFGKDFITQLRSDNDFNVTSK